MQGKFTLKHLHLLHTFLHLHSINSARVSAAHDNNIYFGNHLPEIFSQPQELGVGVSELGMQFFAHIPACNAALIT